MPEKDFRKWYLDWHKENGARLLSDKGLYDYMLDSWLACEAAQPSVATNGFKRSPNCTCDTRPHAPWCIDSKKRRR